MVRAKENNSYCQASVWGSKSESRLLVKGSVQTRVAAQSRSLFVPGPGFRPPSGGSLRQRNDGTVGQVQQSVQGPILRRRQRVLTVMEGHHKLVESSVCIDSKSASENTERPGNWNFNCTGLARQSLVFQTPVIVHKTPASFTTDRKSVCTPCRMPRSTQKPEVGPLCMESLWTEKLMEVGWSQEAATAVQASLAKSTWRTYNRVLNDFMQFVYQSGHTLHSVSDALIADFLLSFVRESTRPKSQLSHFSAALSCLSKVSGISVVLSQDLRKLLDGLIRERTTCPLKRSAVMPMVPFIQLFVKWKPNFGLSLERLRLKAVTLFALAAMLRPSDVAPASGKKFTRDSITHLDTGALQIYLHHIKNDRDRDGFRIVLQPSKNPQLCPVDALTTYMARTTLQAGGPTGPVS